MRVGLCCTLRLRNDTVFIQRFPSGNLFGIANGDDVLMQAPAINSYQGALMELRRLQQFALKFNDFELQEILFNARCAAEDRSAARVVAEKYLTLL